MESRSRDHSEPDQGTNEPSARAELSAREVEILRLVATGASNKQVAQQLTISQNTVKVHLRNIFAKINVTSRTEATVYAIRHGLIQVAGQAPAGGDDGANRDARGITGRPDNDVDQPALPLATPQPSRERISRRRGRAAFLITALIVLLVATGIFARTLRGQLVAPSPAPPVAPPRWQAKADMPTARSGLAVATYENEVYAIGGETLEGVIGAVERYDAATDTWATLPPKPVAVTDVSAAVIGGRIYVPGGRLASGVVTNTLEVYNPREDQWEQRAPLPIALSAYALVAFEGRLYLFGGWNGQESLASVYEYDPSRNQWTEQTPMLTARGYAGAAVAGGKVYVIGGRDDRQTLAVNEEYIPEKDRGAENPWQTRAPMPTSRAGMGLAAIADIIHVIGGQGENGQSLTSLKYFPQIDEWQSFEGPMPQTWSKMGLTSLETFLYALGGRLDGNFTQRHMTYQAIYTIVVPVIK